MNRWGRASVAGVLALTLAATLGSCEYLYDQVDPTATPSSSPTDSAPAPPTESASPSPAPTETETGTPTPTATQTETPVPTETPTPAPTSTPDAAYPWHTNIVATTFWVGEIFDPTADDGSQVISTYDSDWLGSYGGCDGDDSTGTCATEHRTVTNGYFPVRMTPLENPFYLDLPFDDVNDPAAFARRGEVIPWATDAVFSGHITDPSFSLMKNRWVELVKGDRRCFGQIEDAGPGQYNDAAYVFGSDDARPLNEKFGGAGADVSPALNGCLGFAELDGDADTIDWRFVDEDDVPPGPWLTLVTRSGVR